MSQNGRISSKCVSYNDGKGPKRGSFVTNRPKKSAGLAGRLVIMIFAFFIGGGATVLGCCYFFGRAVLLLNLDLIVIILGVAFLLGGFSAWKLCLLSFHEVDTDT